MLAEKFKSAVKKHVFLYLSSLKHLPEPIVYSAVGRDLLVVRLNAAKDHRRAHRLVLASRKIKKRSVSVKKYRRVSHITPKIKSYIYYTIFPLILQELFEKSY